MSKKDILKKSLESFRKHINSLSKEELAALKERFKDNTPKGWLSIEDHLPKMFARDIMQGYSVYKVRDKDGNEFESGVSDHNIWYYDAKEAGITHWLNK
jgi:hypothetical protein